MHSQPQQQRIHPEEQHLRNQKPKIDAAIKSFCSYLVATDPEQWTLSNALQISRTFSILLNRHIISSSSSLFQRQHAKLRDTNPTTTESSQSINDDHHPSLMEINAQVWNELVASKQKVTMNLGRDALLYAWEDLDLPRSATQLHEKIKKCENDSIVEEKFQMYVDKFYYLMNHETNHDPDCQLIWGDADRELQRRAQERQNSAAIRREECTNVASSVSSPFIEEFPMDNDEGALH